MIFEGVLCSWKQTVDRGTQCSSLLAKWKSRQNISKKKSTKDWSRHLRLYSKYVISFSPFSGFLDSVGSSRRNASTNSTSVHQIFLEKSSTCQIVDHSSHYLNAFFAEFTTQTAINQNVNGGIDDWKGNGNKEIRHCEINKSCKIS